MGHDEISERRDGDEQGGSAEPAHASPGSGWLGRPEARRYAVGCVQGSRSVEFIHRLSPPAVACSLRGSNVPQRWALSAGHSDAGRPSGEPTRMQQFAPSKLKPATTTGVYLTQTSADTQVMATPEVDEALELATRLATELDGGTTDASAAVAERLVDLVRALDRRSIDPYTGDYLVSGALEVETSLRGRESNPPASIRIGVETIRQALTRVVEGRESSDDRALRELVTWLLVRTKSTPTALAEILDVTPGTVRRWMTEDRDPSLPESDEMQRARILARLVASLSHVLTAHGVLGWLAAPHPALKNKPPSALLGEGAAVPDLISLASQGRSQVAS